MRNTLHPTNLTCTKWITWKECHLFEKAVSSHKKHPIRKFNTKVEILNIISQMFHNDSTILHLSHLALTKKSQGGQGSTNSPFKPPKGKQPYGGCQMKDQIKCQLSQGRPLHIQGILRFKRSRFESPKTVHYVLHSSTNSKH